MSLKKSHPKSHITYVYEDTDNFRSMFSEKPEFRVYNKDGNYLIPIVVLQVEVVNSKLLIVEFVNKSDYNETSDDEALKKAKAHIYTEIHKIAASNLIIGYRPLAKIDGDPEAVKILKVTPIGDGFAIIDFMKKGDYEKAVT